MSDTRVLIIDHYDSFVDMINHYVQACGAETMLIKTDQLSSTTLDNYQATHVIIGPGPGHPSEKVLVQTKQIIANYVNHKLPILGICLGHQLIAEVFGAKVETAPRICHGIIDTLNIIAPSPILYNVANQSKITRYHSLAVNIVKDTDTPLIINAISSDNTIMVLSHKHYHIYGVQFHPESIMSEYGRQIIMNFLSL